MILPTDPGICLDERHNWPHPTKICSLICYLHFMIISCKKSKRSINSSQRYSWSKSNVIWLDKQHKWLHPTKSGSLRCCLPNMIAPCKETKISLRFYNSMQKNFSITWNFPEILMIKTFCNRVRSTTGHIQPRGSNRCYLGLMTIIKQKIERLLDFFQRYCQ